MSHPSSQVKHSPHSRREVISSGVNRFTVGGGGRGGEGSSGGRVRGLGDGGVIGGGRGRNGGGGGGSEANVRQFLLLEAR